MHTLYIFLVLCALFMVVLRYRYFDFLSIYALMLILYNIPTFFGFVNHPFYSETITPNPYIYFYSCLPFIALIYFLSRKQSSYENLNYNNKRRINNPNLFLNVMLCVIFVVVLYDYKAMFTSVSIADMRENISLTANLAILLPPLGLYIAMSNRKFSYALIFCMLIFLIYYKLGTRIGLSMTLLLVLIHFLSRKKTIIASKVKLIFFGVLGLIFIMYAKIIFSYSANLSFLDSVVYLYDTFDIKDLLLGGEFIGNSSILNEVIEQKYNISSFYYLTSLLAILPIPMSFWGLSSSIFNELFQNDLFLSLEYGLAYNIWAEAYSWADFGGISLLSVLIPLILVKAWDIYVNKPNTFDSYLALIIAILLAFWIHRNSLGSILAYMRNIIYPLIFIYMIYSFLIKIKTKWKRILK